MTIETEDRYEQDTLRYADSFRCSLCDMGNYLRPMALDKIDKHDDIYEIYDKLFDIMAENGIDREIVGF